MALSDHVVSRRVVVMMQRKKYNDGGTERGRWIRQNQKSNQEAEEQEQEEQSVRFR